jgi:AraC-like DNA-binding protein
MATAAGFTGLRLARHAVAHGLPRATIATWLGVEASALESSISTRIRIDRLYGAWASLARELGDPAVGTRAALGLSIADLDLFGFCVATAPTARAAARTAASYAALVTDSGQWSVDDEADPVRVTWLRAGPLTLGRAISNEVAVASFAVCFRELTAASPLAVELRRRRPSRSSDHRDLLGCPVRFGSERDGLLFARKELDVVPRQANAALWRFLSAIADGELARLQPRGTGAQVARALAGALDADRAMPPLGAVARALAMSERTLRRRLRGEGTSFRAIADEVRRTRAAELLAESPASMTEVAMAAGFADGSGFGHAWRRWFGAAPSAARRAR